MASSPITSRKIDGEKMETVIDSIFLGFKITAGEGNGSPLQHSCLENPVDGGAWWAAVYGVAQSQTQLKRLSSCSSEITADGDCTHEIKRHLLSEEKL